MRQSFHLLRLNHLRYVFPAYWDPDEQETEIERIYYNIQWWQKGKKNFKHRNRKSQYLFKLLFLQVLIGTVVMLYTVCSSYIRDVRNWMIATCFTYLLLCTHTFCIESYGFMDSWQSLNRMARGITFQTDIEFNRHLFSIHSDVLLIFSTDSVVWCGSSNIEMTLSLNWHFHFGIWLKADKKKFSSQSKMKARREKKTSK